MRGILIRRFAPRDLRKLLTRQPLSRSTITAEALAVRLPLHGATMSNPKKKIIQPRVQTPLPGAKVETATTRLPDDLLSEHVQRLAVAGAVGAGLWLFGFVMDTIVFPLTVGPAPRTLTVVIDVLGVVVSAGMFVWIRHMAGAPQTKADVGLLFMVLNAIFVALVNSQARTVTTAAMGHVSWNTIVILVGSMILPATWSRTSITPRRAALAARSSG